jgi:YHS domain-containing protein
MYINMVMFATGGKIYHFCSCTANKTFKKKINNDGQHFHRKKTTNWASNLKSLNTNKTIQHMSSVKMRGHMLVLLILVELITITV